MSDQLSGRLLAAARVLAGVSRAELAQVTGYDSDTLRLFEVGGSALLSPADSARLQSVLDDFGVVIVPEAGGMGAGVRLKFTRQDTKQITRLEGEGGLIGSDDVP